jgi:hypothetical protein
LALLEIEEALCIGVFCQRSFATSSGEIWRLPHQGHFVAVAMQLIMVIAAHRDRKFIADLAPQRSGLSKFEMVCIAGLALANHTWLCPNKRQVSFAPSSERSIQQSIGFRRRDHC